MSQKRAHRTAFARALRATLGSAALSLTLASCATFQPATVERVDRGQRFQGRYVSVEAYAWYARAANLEARGDLRGAELAYLEASNADPASGAIWARIGAIRCAQGKSDARPAFDEALSIGTDTAVVLVERGRCALRSRKYQDALEDGEKAVARSPDSIGASLLVVDALLGLGKPRDAERWLDALSARFPGVPVVAEKRSAVARERGDTFRARRAAEALDPTADSALVVEGRAAVDDALVDGRLDLARQRALTLRMQGAELALRAVALGQSKLGLEQARFVLDASPDDANARIAELSALERSGKLEEHSAALVYPTEETTELDALAVLLFGELLERRAGADAASAWLRANPVSTSSDPLVEKLRRRAAGLDAGR